MVTTTSERTSLLTTTLRARAYVQNVHPREGKRLGRRAKRSSPLQSHTLRPSKGLGSQLSTYNTANPNAPATIAAHPLLTAAAPSNGNKLFFATPPLAIVLTLPLTLPLAT